MKTTLLFLLLTFSINAHIVDMNILLTKNKFSIIDIKYNGSSGMQDLEDFYKLAKNDWRANLETRPLVCDTNKVEQKKLLKGLKFSKNDTLLIYDWDTRESTVPFNVMPANLNTTKTILP